MVTICNHQFAAVPSYLMLHTFVCLRIYIEFSLHMARVECMLNIYTLYVELVVIALLIHVFVLLDMSSVFGSKPRTFQKWVH